MKCDKLKLNLSIYLDDVLTEQEKATLEMHLEQCQLCRQKLAGYRALRRDLQTLPIPSLSENALRSIRARVADQIMTEQAHVSLSDSLSAWARVYLLPSTIGTFATLLIGLMFLWTILSVTTPEEFAARYEKPEQTKVLLARATPSDLDEFELSPADYARARLSVSGESPSLNPNGALVALTKSFMRGEMKDEELVVVADVFGNGLARIAEVVEPSADRQAVRELEKALKTNPDYAPPFLPANLDHRTDSVVRVVLKFQTVNVDTNKASN